MDGYVAGYSMTLGYAMLPKTPIVRSGQIVLQKLKEWSIVFIVLDVPSIPWRMRMLKVAKIMHNVFH
jgi:hypothetical protein